MCVYFVFCFGVMPLVPCISPGIEFMTPALGIVESKPLDHQGSVCVCVCVCRSDHGCGKPGGGLSHQGGRWGHQETKEVRALRLLLSAGELPGSQGHLWAFLSTKGLKPEQELWMGMWVWCG